MQFGNYRTIGLEQQLAAIHVRLDNVSEDLKLTIENNNSSIGRDCLTSAWSALNDIYNELNSIQVPTIGKSAQYHQTRFKTTKLKFEMLANSAQQLARNMGFA